MSTNFHGACSSKRRPKLANQSTLIEVGSAWFNRHNGRKVKVSVFLRDGFVTLERPDGTILRLPRNNFILNYVQHE